MNKLFTTIILLQLAIAGYSQNQVEIKTSAICEMCKHAIEYELTFSKGVKNAALNLTDKVVTINYNPKKTTPDNLRKIITHVGYHADGLRRDSIAYTKLPFCCKDGGHGLKHE